MFSIYSKAIMLATRVDAAESEDSGRGRSGASWISVAAHKLVALVERRLRIRRARRHLLALDPHLLDDIGLQRHEIDDAIGAAADRERRLRVIW
jgi:uncharacterized protein YjiS (DUF1127 family)